MKRIQMHKKLTEKGLKSELLRFTDEGHGLAKLKNKISLELHYLKKFKKILQYG